MRSSCLLAPAAAMALCLHAVPAQIPSGHVVVSAFTFTRGDPSVYVIDPQTSQVTPMPPLRTIQGGFTYGSGDEMVLGGHPDQILYYPNENPATGNGIGYATLRGSRIASATFTNHFKLSNEGTMFGTFAEWKDALIVTPFSLQLTLPGGLYMIRPWPSGTETLLSSGPRFGVPWVDVSVRGDLAVLFDRTDGARIYVFDLNNNQMQKGIRLNDLLPVPDKFHIYTAAAPGLAIVVTEKGRIWAVTLTQAAQIGWIPGYIPTPAYIGGVAYDEGLGVLVTCDRTVYRLGQPCTPWVTLPQAAAALKRISIPRHTQPDYFTYAHGCTASEPYLDVTSPPALGNLAFALTASKCAPSVPAALMLGTNRTWWGQVPLPFDLAPLGMPGCKLLMEPLVLLPAITSAAGAAVLPVPISNDPGLAGMRWMAQWLVGNPGNGLASIRLSEAAMLISR